MLENQAPQPPLPIPYSPPGTPLMPHRLLIVLLTVFSLAVSSLGAAAAPEKKEAKKEAKSAKTATVKVRDITLTVPTAWEKQKPRSRLRAGQFKLPAVPGDTQSAELAIFFFGGAGGGADANIRRWVGQFQAKGRKMKVLQGESSQGPYLLLDLIGTYNQPVGPPIQRRTKPMKKARMLAVILNIKGKGNYFLKLTGPMRTVTAAATQLRQSFGADPKKEKPYSADSKKDKKDGKKKQKQK